MVEECQGRYQEIGRVGRVVVVGAERVVILTFSTHIQSSLASSDLYENFSPSPCSLSWSSSADAHHRWLANRSMSPGKTWSTIGHSHSHSLGFFRASHSQCWMERVYSSKWSRLDF